jgi:hypothetical protein
VREATSTWKTGNWTVCCESATVVKVLMIILVIIGVDEIDDMAAKD